MYKIGDEVKLIKSNHFLELFDCDLVYTISNVMSLRNDSGIIYNIYYIRELDRFFNENDLKLNHRPKLKRRIIP